MRYVYLKNGDAVEQLRRVAGTDQHMRSGPDAFMADFLHAHRDDDVLVLCKGPPLDTFTSGRVVAAALSGNSPKASRFVRASLGARCLATLLRWRPDRIVCGCTGEMFWAASLAAALLRVPLVHTRHNAIQSRTGPGRLFDRLDGLCVRRATGVACHGPFLMDQIALLGVSKAKICEFDVNLGEFATAVRGGHLPDAFSKLADRCRWIFTFVGRIQRDKGVFDLLAAFAKLPVIARQRAGLVFVGAGNDDALLRAATDEAGLQDQVLLTGRMPHAEIIEVLRLSTTLVAPSRPEFPEGRCMAVLEALAAGVPVIAPGSGPFPYAVQHEENGLLFRAGDVGDLATVMTRVTAEPGLVERLRQTAALQSSRLRSAAGFAAAVSRAFGDAR
jgi:glycosyltransferase involved in cell wall biosynthesis